MKLSKIVQLVNKDIEPKQFENEVADEIGTYKKLSHIKGSKIPIILLEDMAYNFSVNDIDYLNLLAKKNLLDVYTVSYIADAILLSSTFDFSDEVLSAKLEDLVMEF